MIKHWPQKASSLMTKSHLSLLLFVSFWVYMYVSLQEFTQKLIRFNHIVLMPTKKACEWYLIIPILKIIAMQIIQIESVPVLIKITSNVFPGRTIHHVYSRTSEQRTLWDRGLCPLFGGCPLFRGCLMFTLYPSIVWFKPLQLTWSYIIHESKWTLW